MQNTFTIFKREFASYFGTPVASVFIFIFLLFLFGLTFFFGFYTGDPTDQADLQRFFFLHPWIFLFFIPAISMRLWAEERRVGTIELLMTLPVTTLQVVIGKFLAAWCFAALALLLTTSIWISVNYLGEPDNGTIFAGYIGSLFMAGSYLAIGAFTSALTKNQVISLVMSVLLCATFVFAGTDMITDPLSIILPQVAVDTVRSFSFLNHFDGITKGLIDLRDVIFFGSLMICFLLANAIVVDFRKAA